MYTTSVYSTNVCVFYYGGSCHPHEWKSFLSQEPTRFQNERSYSHHTKHLSQAYERVCVPGNTAQYIFTDPGRGGMVASKGLSGSRQSKESFFLCAVEFTLSLETEG